MSRRFEVLKVGEGRLFSPTRADLAQQIEMIDKGIARMIRSPATQMGIVDTPFLKKGRVCQFTYFAPDRSMDFFVGVSDTGWVGMLSGEPRNFFRLAKAGQLSLEHPEDPLHYFFVYLRSTRAVANEFRILDNADELVAKAADGAAVDPLKEIRAVYASLIRPPAISGRVPLRAVIYALKKRDLIRYDLELCREGVIQEVETPLEFNLPLE